MFFYFFISFRFIFPPPPFLLSFYHFISFFSALIKCLLKIDSEKQLYMEEPGFVSYRTTDSAKVKKKNAKENHSLFLYQLLKASPELPELFALWGRIRTLKNYTIIMNVVRLFKTIIRYNTSTSTVHLTASCIRKLLTEGCIFYLSICLFYLIKFLNSFFFPSFLLFFFSYLLFIYLFIYLFIAMSTFAYLLTKGNFEKYSPKIICDTLDVFFSSFSFF